MKNISNSKEEGGRFRDGEKLNEKLILSFKRHITYDFLMVMIITLFSTNIRFLSFVAAEEGKQRESKSI